MKIIKLTQMKFALVDDEDFALVNKQKWFAWKSGTHWYARANLPRNNGRRSALLMHRLILGVREPKIECDHINGDGLNNQKYNLRLCDKSGNGCNRGANKNNTSGFKGVVWDNSANKWRARIGLHRKVKHLGLFDTPEEAHAAYCKAAHELHGEFARVV